MLPEGQVASRKEAQRGTHPECERRQRAVEQDRGQREDPPRLEASTMYWNILDSTAHRRPESPVPSSSAPGNAPTKMPGTPPCAASHSQSAPVSNGMRDERDHHCEVMDSRTALSARLLFSGCRSPTDQPFPSIGEIRPNHSRR